MRAGLAPLLILCALVCPAQTQAPVELAAGQPAPVWSRTGIHHRPVDLAAFKGKVVLLTFWATWCAPCLLEIPDFIRWQREYGPRGLQIVAVSLDDEPTPVLALDRKRHLNYPVIMADTKMLALYGGVLGIPATYLIGRDGRVVARFAGETRTDILEEQVRGQLAQP